jgi:hypothetical protein
VLAAGFLETRQVLEATDRQAQVKFGEKRPQEVVRLSVPPGKSSSVEMPEFA